MPKPSAALPAAAAAARQPAIAPARRHHRHAISTSSSPARRSNAPRSYTPQIQTLADWQQLAGTLGIARGVLVQPSVYGFDNSVLLEALADRSDQPARRRRPAAGNVAERVAPARPTWACAASASTPATRAACPSRPWPISPHRWPHLAGPCSSRSGPNSFRPSPPLAPTLGAPSSSTTSASSRSARPKPRPMSPICSACSIPAGPASSSQRPYRLGNDAAPPSQRIAARLVQVPPEPLALGHRLAAYRAVGRRARRRRPRSTRHSAGCATDAVRQNGVRRQSTIAVFLRPGAQHGSPH